MNTTCPVCGGPARRDADTMDTFMCSSWYQFRYADAHNEKEAWNRKKVDALLPVDVYVGGAEHACMHLIYARFFTKAFRDMGYLDFDEPFLRLVHQGTILGPDGFKMSKSRGNVISPDSYIKVYGSDVFRMYLMFGFNYIEGGKWNDDGIKATARFLERVEQPVREGRRAAPLQERGRPGRTRTGLCAAQRHQVYHRRYRTFPVQHRHRPHHGAGQRHRQIHRRRQCGRRLSRRTS